MRSSEPEDILRDLGISDPAEIDIEAIAWYLGASVRIRPLHGCEALIVGTHNKAIITVNAASSIERRRFSIAHELGHWMRHRGRAQLCRAVDIGRTGEADTNDIALREKVADRYAADLLMPRYLFRPAIAQIRHLTFAAINELARQFATSRTATAIRLIEADIFPALIVCHGLSGRKWFVRAPQVPNHWFPREDLDPDGFAIAVLYGEAGDCPMPRKVSAESWFDVAGAERFEVREQTIRVANNEILTLILIDDEEMLEERNTISKFRKYRRW